MRDLETSHLIGKARLLRREGKTYNEIRAFLGPIDDDTLQFWLRGIPRPVGTYRGRAKDEMRRKARGLRAQGMTYEEIGAATGASVGSLSLWLSDMPLERFAPPERQKQRFQETCARSRERRLIEREAHLDAIGATVGQLSERELFVAGVALYWAEGSKSKPWRLSDRVVFINSDPTVVLVFLRWLELIGIERDRIRARLSIHESADLEGAEHRWSEITGIERERFLPASLKRHNPKTIRHNTGDAYIGCIVIDVRRSAELYRSIEGWWRGVAGSGAPPDSRLD